MHTFIYICDICIDRSKMVNASQGFLAIISDLKALMVARLCIIHV